MKSTRSKTCQEGNSPDLPGPWARFTRPFPPGYPDPAKIVPYIVGVKQEDYIKAAYLRAMAVDYGRAFLGVPYRWGGDDPMSGFDCSGFIVEVLQGVGIIPHGRDYSAHDLYTIFKWARVETGYAGCLAFWLDDSGRAVHVMLMVDNEHVIGASGGGSSTSTAEAAARDNAFIKLRPITYRQGTPTILDPFKAGPE